MSDFTAFSDEIDAGMSYLEHHGILGQKWGKKEGPPYPLGSGDHSSAEKSAAKAAGVKVGSDSGKGSIANVKKKSTSSKSAKKVMTEEEKRAAAVEAVKSGDRKKIAKYASYLSSQELQDAENRVRNLSNITREDQSQQKMSKADVAKMEAIRSGDKEKIKEYADKMSYNELSEAMNRVDLNAKLNYVKPPKTALDKLSETMNKVDTFRVAAEKGIAAYNVAAAIYNSTHKEGAQWPIIEKKVNKPENKKEQDVVDKLAKQFINDAKKNVQQTQEQQAEAQAKAEKKAQKQAEKEDKKQEPTENKEEPKTTRDMNEGMVKPLREVSNQKMSDYDDFDYGSIFSESYMQSQRDVSMSTALATVDYENFRDSVRWSDF